MLGYSSNLRKRHIFEVRDMHKLVYILEREGLVFPIIFERREMIPLHDDPLVITTKIAHYNVYKILVNNCSSFDLLYLSTLLDMRIEPKEITQKKMLLVGFNGSVTMLVESLRIL